MCTASVSEYDLGGEGDLFKAPEPIIEEPELAIDPMAAAMSVMSAGDDVMSETVNIAAMESIEEDSLLSDVFYQFEKDFLAKSAIEEPLFELSDLKVPPLRTEEVPLGEENIFNEEGSIQRSISAGCLISPDWVNGCIARPNFLGFQGLDFEAAFGIRRAFSEGDIKNLGNNNANLGNTSSMHSPFERLSTSSSIKAEERREKLMRYRNKKAKRNFGRKIKYACRKALADSQPRVRGRFAKTEDGEGSKPH